MVHTDQRESMMVEQQQSLVGMIISPRKWTWAYNVEKVIEKTEPMLLQYDSSDGYLLIVSGCNTVYKDTFLNPNMTCFVIAIHLKLKMLLIIENCSIYNRSSCRDNIDETWCTVIC